MRAAVLIGHRFGALSAIDSILSLTSERDLYGATTVAAIPPETAMRTRSQPSVWAQARQLALIQQQHTQPQQQQQQQQSIASVKQPEPVRKTPVQRKRKLHVVTTDAAPAAVPSVSSAAAASGMKSILDYISPKKAKADDEQSAAARKQPAAQPVEAKPSPALTTSVFKTPMKKPSLYIDTRAPPIKDHEVITLMTAQSDAEAANTAFVGERKSIMDYISPNSKNAKLESDRETAAGTNATQPRAENPVVVAVTKRPSIRRTLSYTSEDVLSDSSVDNLEAPEDAENILLHVCGSQRKLPLVGREAEQATIASILNGVANSERQRSLFIIGPPGTGKSSSVDQLLGKYERRTASANAVIRMNCSTYTNPIALYAEIDDQLRARTPWKLPYLDPYFLDEFLEDAAKKCTKCETVLVLDEMDQLLRLPSTTQKYVQDILRFLVRWAALPFTQFKFIGIMNGVDMHAQLEAFLPKDLNVPHVLFPAYTYSELLAILNAHVRVAADAENRSASVDALVERRALELIARKVASRDGDVRRAISLLQQCARFCLRRSESAEVGSKRDSDAFHKITLKDVLACSSTMLASGPVRDVHQLPRLPKILLYVITSIAPSDGKPCDMGVVSQELARLRAIPDFAWMPLFNRDDLQVHLASLECYALVKRPAGAALRASNKNFWKAKLTSAVTLDVVDKAVQDEPLLCTLSQRA